MPLFLAVVAVLVGNGVLSEPDGGKVDALAERGERIVAFARKTEAWGFSGAVLAARDGKLVTACGVGFADLEGKVANTPETLFEIASASKQFTGAAVVKLAQDGKLGLDDPISKHLPGVPKSCDKITVRHLLQHTSGIPGSNSAGGGNELAKVLPAFLRGGPVHEPGTHFEYWNQGYALASEVIARASGKSYTTYLREALFVPAEMPQTRFTGDAAPKVEGVSVAIGRSVMGEPRSALEHPYGEYGFQYRGMGGVVTNVRELWKWDRALAAKKDRGVGGDGAVLSEASLRELFKPGLESYALGWRVGKDAHGRMVQLHGGRVRGFVCEVRRLPDDDGCVLVLANRDDAPVRQVADGVQALLLGKPYVEVRVPGVLSMDLLTALAGKYKDAKGNVLTVEVDGCAAKASIVWAANAEWNTRAWIGADEQGQTVWFDWTETTPITVNRPGEGTVVSIEMLGATYSRVREGGPRRRRSGE